MYAKAAPWILMALSALAFLGLFYVVTHPAAPTTTDCIYWGWCQ